MPGFSDDLPWDPRPQAPLPHEPHDHSTPRERAIATQRRSLSLLGHPAECRCAYECGPIWARLAELETGPRC